MSDLEPIHETTETYTRTYTYIGKEGEYLENNIELHNHHENVLYIDRSSFTKLANNFGINLDELYFKYATISEIFKHENSTSNRCYQLAAVTTIFSELKAGLVVKEDFCCYSKSPLCSAEMRDKVCRDQISNYPPGFLVKGGECLLNEDRNWYLSKQRLRAQGILFYEGDKEITVDENPLDNYYEWTRYLKKKKEMLKKALRLDKQKSLIYGEKGNIPNN